ncbi:MAG: hypothetical protein ACI8QS_001574 [Planctomycetota bacterium]|jgi:hypothetical protein
MARLSAKKLELLRQRMALKGMRTEAATAIPRRAEEGDAPASFGQERLWFLEQLEPGTSLYNDCLVVRLEGGAIDQDLFQRCVDEVMERHEVLRTTLPASKGMPVQRVHADARLIVARHDLCKSGETEQERILLELVQKPFPLEQPPLLRAALLHLDDDVWEFAMCMHHIISDGVSYGIFYREVGALYAAYSKGEASPLSALAVQFGDYAAWERSQIDEARIQEKLPFWKKYLGGELPHLALPFDRARPEGETRHAGAFHRFRLSDTLYVTLESLAKREKVTPHWALLAGFMALLHTLGGQTDLRVGLGTALRTKRELEHLVGFFVQTAILRMDVDGDPSFRHLADRARDRSLEVARHEEVPFDRVVQAIRPRREPGLAPVIQAWFGYMKDLIPVLRLPGMRSSYRILDPKTARFDLCLILDDAVDPAGGKGALNCYFEYDADLLDSDTVASIADRYIALLEVVLEHPDTTLALLREEFPVIAPKSTEADLPVSAAPRPKRKLKKVRRRTLDD